MISVKTVTAETSQTHKNKAGLQQLSMQLAALSLFLVIIAPVIIAPTINSDQTRQNLAAKTHKPNETASRHKAEKSGSLSLTMNDGLYIGAYGGSPYTYPSDVRTIRPNGTDFTLKQVPWRGEPFKSPVYYGVRIAKWSRNAPFGAMLDFTHSKAIANRSNITEQTGTINNEKLPAKTRIEERFRKLEFSHGHNMLTMNGLYRLPVKLGPISPYLGLGAGISIPHTEIHFTGDVTRTYEYQYTGPAVQALFGLEFQLPKYAIFLEYKFTFADYQAPLTFRNGTWVIQDLWAQFQNWQSGKSGELGSLSTKLTSHQIIGGLGVRITRIP